MLFVDTSPKLKSDIAAVLVLNDMINQPAVQLQDVQIQQRTLRLTTTNKTKDINDQNGREVSTSEMGDLVLKELENEKI